MLHTRRIISGDVSYSFTCISYFSYQIGTDVHHLEEDDTAGLEPAHQLTFTDYPAATTGKPRCMPPIFLAFSILHYMYVSLYCAFTYRSLVKPSCSRVHVSYVNPTSPLALARLSNRLTLDAK